MYQIKFTTLMSNNIYIIIIETCKIFKDFSNSMFINIKKNEQDCGLMENFPWSIAKADRCVIANMVCV